MPTAQHQKLINQAFDSLESGDDRRAHELTMSVLKANPQVADGYYIMAMIAQRHGNSGKAEEVIRRALHFDQENNGYLLFQAQCLLDLNRHALVKEILNALAGKKLNSGYQNDTLGVLHARLGQQSQALGYFESACELVPNSPEFLFNLGSCQQFCGELEGARSTFEKIIKLEPKHYSSHLALAQLQKHTQDDNHLEKLLGLRVELNPDEADAHLYLGHALAKVYEDLKDYDNAFRALQLAKRAKLENLRDTPQPDFDATFAAIRAFANVEQRHTGFDSDEPVFIVGMPRTGTTLVERILSSHSQVESAGELANLSLLVKQQLGTQSPWVLDAETMSQAGNLDFEKLGSDYLASTRHLTGSSPHFIDKMPLNFLYIPIILRALPRAKIICLRRNPMDTCLSNYRQLFSTRFAYYSYAYSLADTAEFYTLFHKLMAHFTDTYGEKIYSVHYETLVQSPEREARNLVAYCGLEWEAECLQFQDNTAPVATASSLQVREKLYTRGIERWRHYEPWLDDLRESTAEQFDYLCDRLNNDF